MFRDSQTSRSEEGYGVVLLPAKLVCDSEDGVKLFWTTKDNRIVCFCIFP